MNSSTRYWLSGTTAAPVVEVRSVVLIALLALVRRFVILDVYEASPGSIAALAGATVALGIVFWLVADRREPKIEAEAE